VVHALRIPYEAVTALAACPRAVPLAVSIWGNDLTHEAARSRPTGRATRRVLARADLVFADCQRDIDLARGWGLRPTTPAAILPGGGGIGPAVTPSDHALPAPLARLLEAGHRLVVNARGRRPYVRNDVLLAALSLLADELDPRVRVVFVGSAHDETLRRRIHGHPLADQLIVTEKYSRDEVFSLLRRAEASVSITDQDGTPNSLLEAMAAGAIPVCGDLPSIREWIEHGGNGFLAAYDDPAAVAAALRLALGLSDAEREAIQGANRRAVATRADRAATGRQAAERFGQLLTSRWEPSRR
jgi:glycosyltransferase involved in cell wall biosynthesis